MEEETVSMVIRDIPDDLYVKLKRKAKENKMSMNQYLLHLIKVHYEQHQLKKQAQQEEERVKRRLKFIRQRMRKR